MSVKEGVAKETLRSSAHTIACSNLLYISATLTFFQCIVKSINKYGNISRTFENKKDFFFL